MTSHNIDTILVIQRGRLAVHTALFYGLGKVFGSEDFRRDMTRDLAVFLESEAVTNPYRQLIDRALLCLVRAAPQFVDILAAPEGWELAIEYMCSVVDEPIADLLTDTELEQAQTAFQGMKTKLEESLGMAQGDGLSPLGDELEVSLVTIANEPERLRKIFPPRSIGLGAGEIGKLERALGFSVDEQTGEDGVDQYAQALFPSLLQIVNGPAQIKLGSSPANSPVWKWAGVQKPSKKDPLPPLDAIDAASTAVANLLVTMGTQGNRHQMVRYLLSRMLRQEYSLGEGRGHEATSFSDLETRRNTEDKFNPDHGAPGWDSPDSKSDQSYEHVEARIMLENIRESAPPAQQEAMDLYLEALESGIPLADICRQRGKDPNLVRNNLQALKRSAKTRFSPK